MSAFDAYCRLDAALDGSIVCDEGLSRHTTYRIGGPAALYICCDSTSDLELVLKVLSEEEVEWTIIGRGSNLLVADEGYNGAIIYLGHGFSKCDLSASDRDSVVAGEDGKVKVTAGASMILSHLVQRAFGHDLAGFEFAVGVPGTLGGALFMNAGSRDSWIGSIVDSITCYAPGKGLVRHLGSDIPWDYRSSGLPTDEVIVEATMLTYPTDAMMLHSKMEASLNRRKRTQPFGMPSCGSVFRNPDGDSAGRLIEECGLKGEVCGGAQISEKHANFIVNTGNATAADVLALIHKARSCVKEEYGIELKPEVKFLGFE